MKANTAGGRAHAGADFEELGAKSIDLGGAPGLRQLQAEQVDQVVSEAVQEQAEGVGQEALTAQAVGAEAVFDGRRRRLAVVKHFVSSDGCSERGCCGAETQCSSPF